MSTNKTTNRQLHNWSPGDSFLREEFNENFTRLDQVPEAVFGSYTGNGARQRFISLGFTPKAVLVEYKDGIRGSSSCYGGMALPGRPLNGGSMSIAEGGIQFTWQNDNEIVNSNGAVMYYIAFC